MKFVTISSPLSAACSRFPLLLWILFFVVTVPGTAADTGSQSESSLLIDIGLVESSINGRSLSSSGSLPPHRIGIGIYAAAPAYYRLNNGSGGIINGGLLQPGFNLLEIEADGFFKKSNTYYYTLALKKRDNGDAAIQEKRIAIHIELETVESGETTPSEDQKKSASGPLATGKQKAGPLELSEPGCSVSLFIEDRLILCEKKVHDMKISSKAGNEPVEIDYGKESYIDGTYPSLESGGVPILPLAALLIKKLVFKKKDKMTTGSGVSYARPGPLDRMTVYFNIPVRAGKEKRMKAVIRLGTDTPPG